ncbi:MAG: tRNA (guanosine(37)-N1)-methyltransferase TrmD, partial [Actinobacteria bacterium]|nr:tRNA (guanosine(37)-N1)-methyltransferase TrmD [Actinomycetota bacterium]
VLCCGRYEGIDERVHDLVATDEVSVGDYVLFGGEVAAAVVIEAVTRLVPGVVGNDASPEDESFSSGLLEYPHYTRPADLRGHGVPEVLTSGDHGAVDRWRAQQALELTRLRRPDLLPDGQSPPAG